MKTAQEGVSQRVAREAMGGNMFGFEEAERLWGVAPRQLVPKKLFSVPCSENVLRRYRDHYVLLFGLPAMADGSPLNIRNLRKRFGAGVNGSYFSRIGMREAGEECEFTLRPCTNGWWLLRKEVMPASLDKDFDCQDAFLRPHEARPYAIDVVYAAIAVLRMSGGTERIFRNEGVWCADRVTVEGKEYFVRVGYNQPSPQGGMHFWYYASHERNPELGLAPIIRLSPRLEAESP